MHLFSQFPRIADTKPETGGDSLSASREGRPIFARRFGCGEFRISLVGGCHADEPVGPEFLRKLSAFLASPHCPKEILEEIEWWIVPHINPDGEERNKRWFDCGHADNLAVSRRHLLESIAPADLPSWACRPGSSTISNALVGGHGTSSGSRPASDRARFFVPCFADRGTGLK